MVQLVRPAEPAFLARNRGRWTIRWTDSLAAGRQIEWATVAAKRSLRGPLLDLSWGKCAFCEGTLNLTSFIEIEHYHSKRVRPHLVFEWQNLFPSCGMCNQNKSDIDHNGMLLKPDAENPEILLWLDPGTGELQPHPTLDAIQAQRVQETLAAYNLQRGALCIQRIEMMKFVHRWLSRVAAGLGDSPECQDEWRFIVKPSTPLKFVIRHILTQRGQGPLAEIDRQTFLHQA